MTHPTPKPLDGMLVTDITHVMAGPFCTHVLRLLGARVVKIEQPGDGDVMRYYGRDPAYAGMAPPFMAVNLGKESMTLDLKKPEGLEIARRLIDRSDALVENFRPGVLARLGLATEVLQSSNPGLVSCSITGFGQSGPLRDHPAYDHIVQGVCGVMSLTGGPGSGPTKVGFPVVDTFTGYAAAFGVVAALLQRTRTGRGQVVDVAMLDASLVLMISMVAPYLMNGVAPEKVGNRGFNGSPTSDTFPTADRPITLGANTQRQFEALCHVLGREELITDPRFPTPAERERNEDALQAELLPTLATRSASEWEERLNAVGVPAGAVRDIPEIVREPHLEGRELLIDVAAQTGKPAARSLNAGFQFASGGPGVSAPAPRLGEHTCAILAELGYTATDIERFRMRRAI